MGIETEQFLAKLVTNLAKPKGVRVLHRRDVSSLLASTPATKIPGCGAGSVAAGHFAAWGVSSLLHLSRVTAGDLQERLGEQLGAKVKPFVSFFTICFALAACKRRLGGVIEPPPYVRPFMCFVRDGTMKILYFCKVVACCGAKGMIPLFYGM